MAIPSSRSTFKEYCLRNLGKGVIDINVSDDQAEDRIDEALQYFAQYHYDGVERMYLKHEITQADVDRSKTNDTTTATDVRDGSVTASFTEGRGFIPMPQAVVSVLNIFPFDDQVDDRIDDALQYFAQYHYDGVERMYLKHEITQSEIDRAKTDASATATDKVDNSITATWKEGNNFIPVPDSVLAVVKVFDFSDKHSLNMFDVRYQLRLNDLYDFSSESVIHYEMTMRHLDFLDHILVGEKPLRFNQHQNRLYIDMNWSNDITAGDFIIIECYRKLDPTTYTDIFNDIYLKRYTTALIKRQWGANLSKFEGVQMLGGVTLNGAKIFEEAQQDIEKLEEQIQLAYELPPNYMIG